MKTLWSMLGALLISIVIMELGKVYVTYDKIYTVTEHALDAALIQGIKEQDARYGVLYIDAELAKAAAEETFKENLGLDDNLENEIMKDTRVFFEIHQGSTENPSGVPYVSGVVYTSVTAMSPTLFGQPAIPIEIRKNQYHLTTYFGTE